MSCQIKFNDQGQVTVITEQGEDSILYAQIASNPLMNQDKAVEAYKNIFSKNFNPGKEHPIKTNIHGEPVLYYLTPEGKTFKSYKEALDNTQTGDIQGVLLTSDNTSYNPDVNAEIFVDSDGQIHLNSEDAYSVVFSVNANSNEDTLEGFINKQIRLGQISGESRLVDGVYELQGAGTTLVESEFGYLDAIERFGRENVSRDNTGIIRIIAVDNNIISFKGGEITKEQFLQDLKEGKHATLEAKMSKPIVAQTAFNLYREKNNLFKAAAPLNETVDNQTEAQLINHLTSFLNKIGVNLTSIEDYKQRYLDKTGVEASAEALADIANKVIAFSQGQITVDNLTEEVSHFAVEAYQDQELLNRMLQNVHLTNEWAQDAQRYLEVYGKKYQGAELDNITRREILGKILARKLQERFVETQNTPVEAGLTNLLANLWNSFISRIRQLFTPSIQQELDGFTDAIANNILNEQFDDIFSTTQLSKSEFTFYSLADKRVTTRLQKYYNSLQRINEQLKKSKTGNIDTDLTKADAILKNNNDLDAAELWIVVQRLNAGLSVPLNKTSRVVEEAMKKFRAKDPNQNKLYLDGETISAIQSLLSAREAVQEVISLVENGVIEEIEEVDKNTILRDLKAKLEQLNRLERDRDLLSLEGTEYVVERIRVTNNLPESYVENLRRSVGNITKDITFFGRWFGQPGYANNQWLNILSKIFADNRTKANIQTQIDVDGFLSYISDNNYNRSKFDALIEKDSKGRPTGWLISKTKLGEFYQDLENEKVRNIRNLLNIPETESNAEVLKKEINLSQLQKQEYNDSVRTWLNENTERQFDDEYYKALEERTAFMAPETKEFLKNLSQRRYRILNKYPNKGAIMSDADIAELDSIARDRKFAKSERNEDGSLKEEGTEEYQISQDLIKADANFAEQNKDNVLVLREEFLSSLTALEGTVAQNKDALKFIISNGGIRYTREFYDALGTRSEDGELAREPKVVQRLRNADIAEEDTEIVEELSDSLTDKLNERQDILRKHQKTGNPSEVDVSVMGEISKERVRILDTEIQALFQQANQILRRNGQEEITPPQVETENTENASYYDDLFAWGLNPSQLNSPQEQEFILENVSPNDRIEIFKFNKKVSDLRDGTTYNIEPKYKRFFAKYFNLSTELSEDEFYDEVVDKLLSDEYRASFKIQVAFGKTKLYSYYKRFAPKGYSELFKALQNGEIAPSRLLNDRENLILEYPAAEYLEITPNYTWMENASDSQKNPNYDENWEGGFYQPKISKYRNEEYYNKFRLDVQGQATQSREDFEMLQLFQDATRTAHQRYGVNPDIYKLPQISKSDTQKVADALNIGVGETIKRSFKDTFINRIDEADYGQLNETETSTTIPIKYVYDLEEKSDVSLDLALSYSELLAESNHYTQRKNSVGDVMAIRQQIAEQQFTNGKTGDASNAIQMADNFIAANIYGVKQSRKLEVNLFGFKIDLSRLALVLHKRLQYGALAFSPVIALTNYFTGYVNLNTTESLLGQFINQNSNLYAAKEFNTKEIGNLVAESGKLNRSSKVYKLLESGGVIDIRNRVQNSNLGRVGTMLSNLGWAGLFAGDVAIKSRVFIATFDDMRAVEGVGFMTYNQYKLRPENEGLAKKEITDKWNTLRDNSLWNALENEGTSPLKIKQQWIDAFGQETMDNVLNNTLQKASATSAQIDGQTTETERIAASRDYMLRFATGMRGYLFQQIGNRLQGRKYSLLQNQEVEGSYISSGRYINNIVRKMIDDRGVKNMLSIIKEEWRQADDLEKTNIKRVIADFSVFLVLLGLSSLAFVNSDDDDPYLYTLGAYILTRTTAETGSAALPINDILGVIDKPIMAASFLKEISDVSGLFEEVKSGRYQGTTRLFSIIYKNTPIKQLYQMNDLYSTSEQYRRLNENLLFLSDFKNPQEAVDYFNAPFGE